MKRDILALVGIAAVVTIFFARLFWPEPQIILTPDFGRSDAWHFSLATKLALAEHLKRGELPLWEPRMGGGFPLFAEGQVGALFLPNLILFRLMDNPIVAYNATYVALFLIMGWGMYAWLRVIGCTRIASLFGAITIVFSGQTIPRLAHHTLLQSLSMTPLVLALGHMVLTKKQGVWITIFAFAVSQQFFTGSPQPVLVVLLMLGIYAAVTAPRRIGLLVLGIVLGAGIAAVQLIPSAEMLRESTSPGGFSPEEASYYSFPLVHLKTLVSAFILGNPRLGTYPPFSSFDGSIFWENNIFIGWIAILLALLGLQKWTAATIVISFLLMLGKYSPLYLFYSVWPLNLFRVPSRFAWVFLLTIVTAASRALSHKKIPAIITVFLLLTQSFFLISVWWDYHAIAPARMWVAPPAFLQTINAPVRTIGSERAHNTLFLTKGWGGNLDQYRFLTNALAPNSNLYWNIPQTDVYAGRFLKRPALVESLLGNEVKLSEYVATISAQGKRLLHVYHAQTIVSTLPLDTIASLAVVATTRSGELTITAYRNADALPHSYLATQTITATTLTKASEALGSPAFIPGKTAVVHDEKYARKAQDGDGGILVFADTYYPGWIAKVDGKPAEVFPVNIKERGIRITEGDHMVVWEYKPASLRWGAWISAGTTSTIIGYLLWLVATRIHQAVPWLSPRSPRSRGR